MTAIIAFVLLFNARPISASEIPLPERVLVVVNGQESASKKVAAHYMTVRGIAAANRCVVKPFDEHNDATGSISWEEFQTHFKLDVRKCLERAGKSNILYIVLSYLVPYGLHDVPPGFGSAIDSHLADVWNALPSGARPINSYYAAVQPRANNYAPFVSLAAYRDVPGAVLVYSVWRLDGPNPRSASALVDKAMEAERSGARGMACFDRRFGESLKDQPDDGMNQGDWQLLRAAELARAAGLPVLEDWHAEEFGTPPAPKRCDDAILYSGWYTLYHYNDAFTWSVGAIGFHLDSDSLPNPREGGSWSAMALARGITVTSGAIAEPYLEGLPRPAGVVYALLHGANVGDAFLRSTLWLRWQILNVGDPLYRPFPGGRGPFATDAAH